MCIGWNVVRELFVIARETSFPCWEIDKSALAMLLDRVVDPPFDVHELVAPLAIAAQFSIKPRPHERGARKILIVGHRFGNISAQVQLLAARE